MTKPTDPPAGPPAATDPSMEDILASIRRILSEEEAAPADNAGQDDVLILDPSMLVSEPPPATGKPSDHKAVKDPPELQAPPRAAAKAAPVSSATAPSPAPDPLVAPAAAAAAASSVGSLLRTLTTRTTQVYSGGPTLEDIVREEIKPQLKQWLDANLPPLVERLVRAEIERVVGRAGP